MIEIRRGIKIFRTDTVLTHALHEVDMQIHSHEFVAIMGRSGSGKTTLLNVIGMLETLDSGSYTFNGEEVDNISYRERLEIKRKHFSFVFQSFNLIAHFSVLRNVELPLKYRGIGIDERRRKADEILEKLDMTHRKNHFPSQLSGGEQQRVAIARAAVTNPSVVLADEPTGNLDTQTGSLVLQQLKELHQHGATIVMVTHSEEAANVAGRCIPMRDGIILNSQD